MSELAVEGELAVYLPWQAEQWQRISALRESGRLPHALLLSGSQGIGKARFARALAQFLMCEQPVGGTACGQCRQCHFNRAATHPDMKWVEPESAGKQIRVDQIRELVDFLGHTSQQGGYKVTVIHPAEAMNINAANALLKCLEEPSGSTMLILLSDAPSRLLATIRSRCQIVGFPQPDRQQSLDWLRAVLGPQSDQAERLLSEAQGRPMRALELLCSDGLEMLQQLDTDFLTMIEGRAGAVTIAEKWLAFELADVLVWFNQRLTALIAGAVGGVSLPMLWQPWVSRVDPRALYAVWDRGVQLQQQMSRGGNPNRQLALEDLLLFSCDKFHKP